MDSPTEPSSQQIREKQIAERAYQFYEDEGRPDGRDQEHWFRAERTVREQRLGAIVPPDAGP